MDTETIFICPINYKADWLNTINDSAEVSVCMCEQCTRPLSLNEIRGVWLSRLALIAWHLRLSITASGVKKGVQTQWAFDTLKQSGAWVNDSGSTKKSNAHTVWIALY